jgi:integrase
MPYKRGYRWVAQVRKNGKRKEAIFKTEKEALNWEADWRRKPIEAWEGPETRTGCSLIDWAEEYLNFAKVRFTPKVYNEKRFIFKRLFKSVDPEMPVSEIGPRLALSFLQKQAEERSGYAANKERKNLLAAWNWGIKYMGLASPNPFLVDKFPEQRHNRYIPPEDDFWKVYNVAEDQDQVMLLAYLQLAARRSELFRLRWEDVDFGKGEIRLTTRKRMGGSLEEDWLPMLDELHLGLLHHKQSSKGDWVFPDPETGAPYRCRQHWMKRLCNKAGICYFGLHAIRHLTASILANEGVPVIVIQAILRHKNSNTTQRYLHRLSELKTALGLLSQRKSRLVEPSHSTKRRAKLKVVNN